MRLQTLRDVKIEHLLHIQELPRQLLVLLGKLLVLLPQRLDAIRLQVIPHRTHIGRNEEDWTCERRLEAEE